MTEQEETRVIAPNITVIDVAMYGADPTGRTDSSAAFQRAIDDAARLPAVEVRSVGTANEATGSGNQSGDDATGTVV